YKNYSNYFSREGRLFLKENVIGFIGTYFTEQALDLNDNIIKLTEKNYDEKVDLYDIDLVYIDNDIYEKDNEFFNNRLLFKTIKFLQREDIKINIVQNSEKPLKNQFDGFETLKFNLDSQLKDSEISNELPPLVNYKLINTTKTTNKKDILILSIEGKNHTFHQKRLLSNKDISKEILFINNWSRKNIQTLIRKMRESKVIYINYSNNYDGILL